MTIVLFTDDLSIAMHLAVSALEHCRTMLGCRDDQSNRYVLYGTGTKMAGSCPKGKLFNAIFKQIYSLKGRQTKSNNVNIKQNCTKLKPISYPKDTSSRAFALTTASQSSKETQVPDQFAGLSIALQIKEPGSGLR